MPRMAIYLTGVPHIQVEEVAHRETFQAEL